MGELEERTGGTVVATLAVVPRKKASGRAAHPTASVMARGSGLLLLLAVGNICVAAARKTNRDFAAMTDKDWERIEAEWETPEEKEEYGTSQRARASTLKR